MSPGFAFICIGLALLFGFAVGALAMQSDMQGWADKACKRKGYTSGYLDAERGLVCSREIDSEVVR